MTDYRAISKSLMGNRLMADIVVAIEDSSTGAVIVRELAHDLRCDDKSIRDVAKKLADAGCVRRLPPAERSIPIAKTDAPCWGELVALARAIKRSTVSANP